MAVLTDNQREEVWAEIMRLWSRQLMPTSLNKSELRAFVDAVDQWIDDNQASFNSAIPEPAKSALTQKEKVRGFMLVAEKRFEVT